MWRTSRIVPMLLVMVLQPSGSASQELTLTFWGDPEFSEAIEEYREIWRAEGARITETLQAMSGLTFTLDSIPVQVLERPSWAGSDHMGMRASYPPDTKRATLAHELGHILIGDLLPEGPPETTPDGHYVLFLFLYDAWVASLSG